MKIYVNELYNTVNISGATMFWVFSYSMVLIGVGVIHQLRQKQETLDSFTVFERKAGGFQVSMSFIALVFGASSVFGLSGYAYQYGMNAVWWTLTGSIFLIVLAFTFTRVLFNAKAINISDIIASVFGEKIRFFTSIILVLAWLMVLAGQIIAGGSILNLFLHNQTLSYVVFTLIFSIYTVLAGQAGAMKTGFIQSIIMTAGLVLLLVVALKSIPTGSVQTLPWKMGFNEQFSLPFFLNIFIPVGLSYLFGPDMYTRIFTAKDVKSARTGLITASVIIALLSVLIVSIGIVAKPLLGTVVKPDTVIPLLVSNLLTGTLGDVALLALISIPLSGADIMLLNLSVLLGRDILIKGPRMFGLSRNMPSEKTTLRAIRISIVVIAVFSTWMALKLSSIIPALLIAYKIFSIGIVPLLFTALLSIILKRKLEQGFIRLVCGIYLILTSVLVFLIEWKVIASPIPYYNLYLIGFNTLVCTSLLFFGGKKDGETVQTNKLG